MVITLEAQKRRKKAPYSVKINVLTNCCTQKWFSHNGRRRANLQNVASIFFFAQGLSYDLSKFGDDLPVLFRL